MESSKRDWKLLREKLPCWQEAYMDRLNREYVALLNGEGCPSEKFWTLYNRIRDDKQSPGVQVSLTRTELPLLLARLLNGNVIAPSDLDDFSEELRKTVLYLNGRTSGSAF